MTKYLPKGRYILYLPWFPSFVQFGIDNFPVWIVGVEFTSVLKPLSILSCRDSPEFQKSWQERQHRRHHLTVCDIMYPVTSHSTLQFMLNIDEDDEMRIKDTFLLIFHHNYKSRRGMALTFMTQKGVIDL